VTTPLKIPIIGSISRRVKNRVDLLTVGYICALSLIALLVVISHMLIIQQVQQQEKDASIINHAGRQRMLSQRIVNLAHQLLLDDGSEKKQSIRQQLIADITQLTKVHRQLSVDSGDSDDFRSPSPVIARLFTLLEPHFIKLTATAEAILSESGDKNLSRRQLNDLIIASRSFLAIMDQIVFQYDQDAGNRVSKQHQSQRIALYVMITLPLIEAFSIFRPLVHEVRLSQERIE
jgi:nitrate/nitrite-specific signal transduction histidine kinase